MLVCRLNICRNPTMGEKYVSPLPLSSGLNSSLALSWALLVIAPKRAQVVSLSAFTVRSGSALPSLHQNSQPMSQGTYSASSFRRSSTRRAASMTSCPTPSPGIHAILYLDIRLRFYRRASLPASSPQRVRLWRTSLENFGQIPPINLARGRDHRSRLQLDSRHAPFGLSISAQPAVVHRRRRANTAICRAENLRSWMNAAIAFF